MLSERDKKIRKWFELQILWKDLMVETTRFISGKESEKHPTTFKSIKNIFSDILDEQKTIVLEIWPSGTFD